LCADFPFLNAKFSHLAALEQRLSRWAPAASP
jgi:hypothetical protein